MTLKTTVKVFWAVLLFGATGCAALGSAGHKYIMWGQVLELTDDTAYLCIGSADGAQVGQEYAAYKFTKIPSANLKSVQHSYKREETGTVKILEIVDEHMAKAKVLAGHVETNNMVELK